MDRILYNETEPMTQPPKRDFLAALRQSHSTVLIVAEWLRNLNYQVTLLPNKESPDFESRMDFVDDYDLFLNMPIEVKQTLVVNFKSVDDWPFKYVNVMAAHAWEDKNPKPLFIIVLSQDCTHAIIISGKSEKYWITTKQTDGRDGRKQNVLKCPKEKCKWIKL